MKDDVPVPDVIPKKRRELQSPSVLDRFIAVWLAREDLTPSERRRLEEEKARRKALVPDVKVAVIVGNEGMTPVQRDRLVELAEQAGPTEVHYFKQRIAHLRRFVALAPQFVGHYDERDMLRAATIAIAAPKEPEKPDMVQGVWDAVRFAKHRRIPVRVVMPSGEERS